MRSASLVVIPPAAHIAIAAPAPARGGDPGAARSAWLDRAVDGREGSARCIARRQAGRIGGGLPDEAAMPGFGRRGTSRTRLLGPPERAFGRPHAPGRMAHLLGDGARTMPHLPAAATDR